MVRRCESPARGVCRTERRAAVVWLLRDEQARIEAARRVADEQYEELDEDEQRLEDERQRIQEAMTS